MSIEDQLGEILGQYERGDKSVLIEILQKVQGRFSYIPPEAVRPISRHTKVPESEIFSVATFYSQFRFTEPGKHTIKVCLGTACHVRGGDNIMRFMKRELGIKPGETTADRQFSLEQVACFGCCALSPVVVVDEKVHALMSEPKAQKLLELYSDGKGAEGQENG
jgi:NADH-quinone oxidoreductase subunit E